MLSFHSANASTEVWRQKTSQLLTQARGDGRTQQDCQGERATTRMLQTAPHQELIAAGQGGAELHRKDTFRLCIFHDAPASNRSFPHERAAAKALGMPSDAQRLKQRVLISIHTTIYLVPNGWERGIPPPCFSRENRQKCQVQHSL